MKRLHWYIVFFSFVQFFILTSCTSYESSLNDIKKVDVYNIDSPLKIMMSDIVDSISYIPLNSEDCLLSYVEKIQYDSCFYFVKDAKGLYVFDESGMFVNEIGKKGPGPKEYLYINAFYLDRRKKNVCIISYPDGKLLTYSYSGDFLSKSYLKGKEANVSFAVPLHDNKLLVHYPLPNDADENLNEYVVLIPHENSYSLYPLLENIEVKSLNVHYSFLRFPVAFWNENCYVISTLSNVVYNYVNQSLIPEFELSIPNLSPSKKYIQSNVDLDFFSLLKQLDETGIGKGIMAIASSDENLFMLVENGQTVVYDGKEALVVAPLVYCPDTDNYLSNLLTGGLFDNLIGHYEAEFLLSKKEYINSKNNLKLKQIISNLHEEDNPVVFRCHLKKDLFECLKNKIK